MTTTMQENDVRLTVVQDCLDKWTQTIERVKEAQDKIKQNGILKPSTPYSKRAAEVIYNLRTRLSDEYHTLKYVHTIYSGRGKYKQKALFDQLDYLYEVLTGILKDFNYHAESGRWRSGNPFDRPDTRDLPYHLLYFKENPEDVRWIDKNLYHTIRRLFRVSREHVWYYDKESDTSKGTKGQVLFAYSEDKKHITAQVYVSSIHSEPAKPGIMTYPVEDNLLKRVDRYTTYTIPNTPQIMLLLARLTPPSTWKTFGLFTEDIRKLMD